MTNWEASWGHVGGNWDSQDGTKLGQVEAKLINFGTNLGPSWALLGQVGPCWGHVGTRLGQVGAKLDQVGLSEVQLGAKLRSVGTRLGPSWSQVGPSWSQVGPSWAKLGPSCLPSWIQNPCQLASCCRCPLQSILGASEVDFWWILGVKLRAKLIKKSIM